jgi:hypothetical protein
LQSAADAEQKIKAKRAEGWLLAEPGADPQALVDESREQVGLAAQLLDAGELEGAIKNVELAERGAAEALAMLESIVAAKTRIDELLPGCMARLEALAARRSQTIQALEQMAAAYSESSWTDLADNTAKADEGLARIRTLITEAQTAAEPGRQHFFRALALLEEVVRQQEWVAGCQMAVTDRRTELDGLRASLPARCTTLAQRVGELEQRLERQRTDRVRANDAADTAAVRAEELATEDDRLARQAFAEIEETDSLIRRAAAWYAEGVSADVRAAISALEQSKALLTRQRYEDSIKAAAEAARLGREAYATATAEAERRRQKRLQDIQRRQMEDAFGRLSRGAGPWMISLPSGSFTGPDPWRSIGGSIGRSIGGSSRSAGGSWSRDIAEVRW